jgi:hypothetical protein
MEAAVSIDAAGPATAATTLDASVPRAEDLWTQVPGLSDAVALVGFSGQMCALRKGGSIACYTADEKAPTEAPWGKISALSPATGLGGSSDGELCAIKKKGTVECLDLSDDAGKVVKIPGARNAVSIAADYISTCVLTTKGAVYCRYTDEMTGKVTGPAVRVKGLPPLVSIAAGEGTTGGIDRKGRLWSWDAEGGEEQELTPRSCKPERSYLAENRKKITCTEGAPVALKDVRALVMLPGDVSLKLFYALIGDHGVYAYVDKAQGDTRRISKDSMGARLINFVEDFPLPPNTERLLAAPPIGCSVAKDGAVQCWGDDNEIFGRTPRPTPIRSPVAIATNSEHLCALSKAGTVSCMSLFLR